MASFSVEAMVRRYHVYQDIRTAVVDEEFPCKRKAGNMFDPFAVAVMNGDTNTVILYSFVSFADSSPLGSGSFEAFAK